MGPIELASCLARNDVIRRSNVFRVQQERGEKARGGSAIQSYVYITQSRVRWKIKTLQYCNELEYSIIQCE